MRFIVIPIFTSLFLACSGPEKTQTTQLPHLKRSDTVYQFKPLQLDFTYPVDIKQTPWQGDRLVSVYWKDRRGENILIVSELPQYGNWTKIKPYMKKVFPFGLEPEDCTLAEIFAYHYVQAPSEKKWKSYWTLNDFIFSPCDGSIEYLPGTITITDLDSNGSAESYFAYNSTTCTRPFGNDYDGKAFLYVDSVKYSKKGRIGLGFESNYSPESSKVTYSENINLISKKFRTFMDSSWLKTKGVREIMDKDMPWNKPHYLTP